MKTYTLSATYGSQNTPCNVFVYEQSNGNSYYTVEGSQIVNLTAERLTDGVNVETVEDIDCFTWFKPIESLEELETAVWHRIVNVFHAEN